MSINFDNITYQEILEMIERIESQVFYDILTKKIEEGKIVFCEVQDGLMN